MSDSDPDPVLTVTTGPHPAGPTLITLTGELDFSTVADLHDAVCDTDFTPVGVVMDLTGVLYCDSAGITELVTVSQHAGNAGSPFALAGLSDNLRRVFDIAGLHEIFASYPTVDQAVAAL